MEARSHSQPSERIWSAAYVASLPEHQRQSFLESLSPKEAEALAYDWQFWARDAQLPPAGDWRKWLILAGRGFGKTRTGAEFIRERIGEHGRAALVGPTAADVRDIMVEGESGLLSIYPPDERPTYEPSKRRLTWPNGAIATCYSADEPDRLRGPQHSVAWLDEICSWRYPEALDMLMLGLRLGTDPRVVVTTTPRPGTMLMGSGQNGQRLGLLKDPDCVVVRGSTYDNLANLAPAFAHEIVAQYEGTRLGRQELHAEILDDVPGALWTRAMLDENRVREVPEMARIVVAVDPAVTSGEDSDETGIVVVGAGVDGHGYVLADRSCRMSPDGWARRAVIAYDELKADRIVGEVNNGGDMVEVTIRTVSANVAYKAVHASRGKRVRAEPVAALYEQHRIHHIGVFPELEDQQCTFLPEGTDTSPDRVDALVWGITELMLGGELSLQQEWDYSMGVWRCEGCGQAFAWKPLRPCPGCGKQAPEVVLAPTDDAATQPGKDEDAA